MTKVDLIAKVAAEAELTKKDAEKAVAAVLDGITEALKAGDKVALVGFGTFETRERPAAKAATPHERGDHDPRYHRSRFQGRQGSEGCRGEISDIGPFPCSRRTSPPAAFFLQDNRKERSHAH